MDENLRKFSKVLSISAIVAMFLTLGLAIIQPYIRGTVKIVFLLFVVVYCIFLKLNINSKIKTTITVPLLILPLILGYVENGGFFISLLTMFPMLYPSFILLLVNSWLREITHLDHPKQEKIDKLKNSLRAWRKIALRMTASTNKIKYQTTNK